MSIDPKSTKSGPDNLVSVPEFLALELESIKAGLESTKVECVLKLESSTIEP